MAVILTILAFIWWWPLGLLALGFFLARRRYGDRRELFAGEGPMFNVTHRMDRWERKMARAQEKVERVRGMMDRYAGRSGGWFSQPTSGNHAFDEYRAETLKRLEDEQREFKDFLERLRLAKDRAEFDQFMAHRRQPPFAPGSQGEPPPAQPQA